ncbi:hypothetical protein EVAR_13018_1 [Eumeta japonica]|uniref:Uncharacterized protein n=1 Tax=Eumeta variegata TaxID=151549 RepID=A0A4C1TX15_EUMVA|nr:hypothetical protein EVAR_13018_1 [Eumeta japonica]
MGLREKVALLLIIAGIGFQVAVTRCTPLHHLNEVCCNNINSTEINDYKQSNYNAEVRDDIQKSVYSNNGKNKNNTIRREKRNVYENNNLFTRRAKLLITSNRKAKEEYDASELYDIHGFPETHYPIFDEPLEPFSYSKNEFPTVEYPTSVNEPWPLIYSGKFVTTTADGDNNKYTKNSRIGNIGQKYDYLHSRSDLKNNTKSQTSYGQHKTYNNKLYKNLYELIDKILLSADKSEFVVETKKTPESFSNSNVKSDLFNPVSKPKDKTYNLIKNNTLYGLSNTKEIETNTSTNNTTERTFVYKPYYYNENATEESVDELELNNNTESNMLTFPVSSLNMNKAPTNGGFFKQIDSKPKLDSDESDKSFKSELESKTNTFILIDDKAESVPQDKIKFKTDKLPDKYDTSEFISSEFEEYEKPEFPDSKQNINIDEFSYHDQSFSLVLKPESKPLTYEFQPNKNNITKVSKRLQSEAIKTNTSSIINQILKSKLNTEIKFDTQDPHFDGDATRALKSSNPGPRVNESTTDSEDLLVLTPNSKTIVEDETLISDINLKIEPELDAENDTTVILDDTSKLEHKLTPETMVETQTSFFNVNQTCGFPESTSEQKPNTSCFSVNNFNESAYDKEPERETSSFRSVDCFVPANIEKVKTKMYFIADNTIKFGPKRHSKHKFEKGRGSSHFIIKLLDSNPITRNNISTEDYKYLEFNHGKLKGNNENTHFSAASTAPEFLFCLKPDSAINALLSQKDSEIKSIHFSEIQIHTYSNVENATEGSLYLDSNIEKTEISLYENVTYASIDPGITSVTDKFIINTKNLSDILPSTESYLDVTIPYCDTNNNFQITPKSKSNTDMPLLSDLFVSVDKMGLNEMKSEVDIPAKKDVKSEFAKAEQELMKEVLSLSTEDTSEFVHVLEPKTSELLDKQYQYNDSVSTKYEKTKEDVTVNAYNITKSPFTLESKFETRETSIDKNFTTAFLETPLTKPVDKSPTNIEDSLNLPLDIRCEIDANASEPNNNADIRTETNYRIGSLLTTNLPVFFNDLELYEMKSEAENENVKSESDGSKQELKTEFFLAEADYFSQQMHDSDFIKLEHAKPNVSTSGITKFEPTLKCEPKLEMKEIYFHGDFLPTPFVSDHKTQIDEAPADRDDCFFGVFDSEYKSESNPSTPSESQNDFDLDIKTDRPLLTNGTKQYFDNLETNTTRPKSDNTFHNVKFELVESEKKTITDLTSFDVGDSIEPVYEIETSTDTNGCFFEQHDDFNIINSERNKTNKFVSDETMELHLKSLLDTKKMSPGTDFTRVPNDFDSNDTKSKVFSEMEKFSGSTIYLEYNHKAKTPILNPDEELEIYPESNFNITMPSLINNTTESIYNLQSNDFDSKTEISDEYIKCGFTDIEQEISTEFFTTNLYDVTEVVFDYDYTTETSIFLPRQGNYFKSSGFANNTNLTNIKKPISHFKPKIETKKEPFHLNVRSQPVDGDPINIEDFLNLEPDSNFKPEINESASYFDDEYKIDSRADFKINVS